MVDYIGAIGELDGSRCLMDWKTTTSRYPEEPEGVLTLDPQLVCYSWVSGVSNVALVVFLRKRVPQIQYLDTSITEEQREEFSQAGRRDDRADRGWPLPPPQRHPLPSERLCQLFLCRALPGKARGCR